MPRFLLLRRFVLCLLSMFLLMPQAVDAVTVWTKPSFSGRTYYTKLEAGVPPAEARFPVVVYLPTQGAHSGSFAAGRLVLTQDYTLTYIPEEVDIYHIEYFIAEYNDSPLTENGVQIPASESPDYINKEGIAAPKRSWNAFLLVLCDLALSDRTAYHFAVTFGEEPVPEYVPQWLFRVGNSTPDGQRTYPYEVLNPLPGMRIMSFNELVPDFDNWRPNHLRQTYGVQEIPE